MRTQRSDFVITWICLLVIFYFTPRKTNTSPENQWLEDVFPIELVPFYGTCEFSGEYTMVNHHGTIIWENSCFKMVPSIKEANLRFGLVNCFGLHPNIFQKTSLD